MGLLWGVCSSVEPNYKMTYWMSTGLIISDYNDKCHKLGKYIEEIIGICQDGPAIKIRIR